MPKYDLAPGLPSTLPKPPSSYDQGYMQQLVNSLQEQLRALSGPRYTLVGGGMLTIDLPTSTTGLRSGEVYIDGGVLKVVP